MFVCLLTVKYAPKKQFIARNVYVELMGKFHGIVKPLIKPTVATGNAVIYSQLLQISPGILLPVILLLLTQITLDSSRVSILHLKWKCSRKRQMNLFTFQLCCFQKQNKTKQRKPISFSWKNVSCPCKMLHTFINCISDSQWLDQSIFKENFTSSDIAIEGVPVAYILLSCFL